VSIRKELYFSNVRKRKCFMFVCTYPYVDVLFWGLKKHKMTFSLFRLPF
jgi:hypothetical protein